MIAMTAVQTMQTMQQQKAEAKAASKQSDVMQQAAAAERASAERSAEMVRRQRDMEKRQERRDWQQELSRARVGGVSSESLLASADRFSLSASQKDWLTGQQAQDILNAGERRAADYMGQASSYGAKAKNSRRAATMTMLQGGMSAMSGFAGSGGSMALSPGSFGGSMGGGL